MRSIATALDAVALLKGTASWLPQDDAKMRAWCQKYGEWLRHTPERLTDNSHRWWWGVQQAAVLQCASEKVDNPLVATAKQAIDAIDGKTGIMTLERNETGRDVHEHIFAAHAIMLVWRACENYGLVDTADTLKMKLTATFKLLSQNARALIKDSDHFTQAQLTSRASRAALPVVRRRERVDLEHDHALVHADNAPGGRCAFRCHPLFAADILSSASSNIMRAERVEGRPARRPTPRLYVYVRLLSHGCLLR